MNIYVCYVLLCRQGLEGPLGPRVAVRVDSKRAPINVKNKSDVLNLLPFGIRALRLPNASTPAGGGARLVTNPTCLRACKELASRILQGSRLLAADRTRRGDNVQSQAPSREGPARRCRPALKNARPRAIAFLCTSRAAFCCARPG